MISFKSKKFKLGMSNLHNEFKKLLFQLVRKKWRIEWKTQLSVQHCATFLNFLPTFKLRFRTRILHQAHDSISFLISLIAPSASRLEKAPVVILPFFAFRFVPWRRSAFKLRWATNENKRRQQFTSTFMVFCTSSRKLAVNMRNYNF